MSSSIDERIVQMRFDNKQFESGVQTSIKSLNELQDGLKLDKSAQSLQNLNKVGKTFSLAGIAEGVETIAGRFTNLGIIGMSVLQNLTNTALNAGKRMISALTIDPIKSGLSEYETKINAIQTILTNTSSKGTTLDEVTAALNELNEYADQTIYNFAEMTRNVGTFTAAGIDLNTATTAIKGIANLAAGSGSTSQQASTAMYQLSQALAAGSVKLQDWNSVVNAGMGGELFQNALKKTAKELGIVVDESIPFRESLKDGWITAEVLTKTLNKFAEDEALVKAATQVKTFTQLFDTMKESVQSGWAISWENIIGDKDEATALLTSINDAFGEIVGKSSDARNEMLLFWKTNGGRAALIEAIANAFKTLGSILKPIGEAYRELFPKVTGQNLVDISNRIKELSANFKIGEESINNIKRTFKGLFAVVSIGKQAFTAVAKGLGEIIKYLMPAGSSLLSFSGSIGDFLVALDDSIKKYGIFTTGVEKIVGVVKWSADKIHKALKSIADAFKGLGRIDLSGLDSFVDNVRTKFAPITSISEFVSKSFYFIGEGIKKSLPTLFKIAESIGKVFEKIRDAISDSIESGKAKSIADLINSGLISALLVGLNKFVGSITNITKDAGGFLKGLVDLLDGVKECLVGYQQQLKAGALLKIAIAMGILSASLLLLSTIEPGKLTSSLTAMGAMFIELFAAMAAMEKISGIKGMLKITAAMVGMSIAILLLSVAMSKLASLDWDGITKGLLSIGVLSAMLVQVAKKIDKNSKGLIKASVGLILFAVAMNVLASAVKKIGNLDTGSLLKGLLGINVLLTSLAVFMNLTVGKNMSMKSAAGLLILSGAMILLATAVKMLGSMDPLALSQGMFAFASALTFIMLALSVMPKNSASLGLSLIGIATAMLILAGALTIMGNMSVDEIFKSLGTLGGALTILAVAMNFMKGSLSGAAAVLIIAGALAILAPVLKSFGSMSLAEIGKGLLTLAGVFTILGVAGILLGPMIPVLLSLAGVIALLGVGFLAVGAGILAFSTGLAALAISGAAGAAALVAIITSIVGTVPYIAKTLAQGIIEFAKILGDGAPVIGQAVLKILTTIINVINVTVPLILNCVTSALTQLAYAIASTVPKMVDAGMKLIAGILQGIADNIQSIVEAGIDIILNFIAGINSKLPDIIDTAFKVIIGFINGLADAIRNNHSALYDACGNLITAIVEALIGFLPKIVEIGGNIIEGLIEGVVGMAKSLVTAVMDVVKKAINTVKDALGINSPSKVFSEIGMYSIQGFAGGLKKFGGLVADEAKNVGNNAVDTLKDSISNIGNVLSGDANINPTIRPVMDLSAVTAGAGTINSLFGKTQGISVTTSNNIASKINKDMSLNSSNGTSSLLNGVKDAVREEVGNSKVDVDGVIKVEVVNDKGEIVGIAEKAMKDLLRKESR